MTISEKIRKFIKNNSDEIDKETRFLLEKAAGQARISEKHKPKNMKMDEKSAEEISKDFIKENNLEDIKNVDQMVFEMGWRISFRDMPSAEDTAIVKKTENKANIIVNFPANDYENEKNLLFFHYQIAKAIGYIVISEPPTAKAAGISSLRLRRSRGEMMTPWPCMQHARTGFPGSLTETYSPRRLNCTGGQGCHADYSSGAEQTARACLYTERVILVLFAASGTFAVTSDHSVSTRVDLRRRIR